MSLLMFLFVATVVLACIAIFTGGRIFWILAGLAAFCWVIVFFGLSWWVLFWILIAAALIAVFVAAGASVIGYVAALVAVIALVIGLFVGVGSFNVSNFAKSIEQQLVDNNEQFNLDQSCADPKLKPICDELKAQGDRITKTEKRLDSVEKRLGVVEMVTTNRTVIKSDGGVTDKEAAKALAEALDAAGWGPKDITVNNVDEKMHNESASNDRFRDRIRTKTALVKYLNGNSAAEKANRELVLSEVPKAEHKRLLSGEGFYAVQFKKSSCLSGNGAFKNGKAVIGGTNCHEKGDVLWIYVGSDGVVYWGATVRDDCGNGHLNQAPWPKGHKQPKPQPHTPGTPGTPRTPHTPSTPPSTPPSGPPTTTPPSECKPGEVYDEDKKECIEQKDDADSVDPPDGRDPAPAPDPSQGEDTPHADPTEPADPATTPGSGTDGQAPGATATPSPTGSPAPTVTNAPSTPSDNDDDPDA